MKIDKLNNEFFVNFASYIYGENVRLYNHDLSLKRNANNIKLEFFIGGEMEDGRKFVFKDEKCYYKKCASWDGCEGKDISFQWVNYLLENADELTEEEREEIVNNYNNRIQNEINDYTSKKREVLIV